MQRTLEADGWVARKVYAWIATLQRYLCRTRGTEEIPQLLQPPPVK